jgi:hypothetical protein
MKYVSTKSEVPTKAHWAVFKFGSIFIAGDERSKTNPGHGYGDSQEDTIKYMAFDSLDELNIWLTKENSSYYKFDDNAHMVAFIEPKTIVKTISVKNEINNRPPLH